MWSCYRWMLASSSSSPDTCTSDMPFSVFSSAKDVMALLFCQVHGWTEIVWCSFWHLKSLRECCSDLLVCQESVQTRPLPGQISSVIPMAENSIFWEPPIKFWWSLGTSCYLMAHPVSSSRSHAETFPSGSPFPTFRIVDFEGTHEKPTCRDKTWRCRDRVMNIW